MKASNDRIQAPTPDNETSRSQALAADLSAIHVNQSATLPSAVTETKTRD